MNKKKTEDNSKTSRKIVKREISFDVFFSKLVRENRAHPHHKDAMAKYAESLNFLTGTEEEFERIFKHY